MRTFIAIEVPDSVRRHLGRHARLWQEQWGERLFGEGRTDLPACSWVREENLHVTVKFLGQVPEIRLQGVCEALLRVQPPWPLRLVPDRVECLPPTGPVRVIAVGLNGDLAKLRQLHDAIEQACATVGIPREGRTYRPHITLARARTPLPQSIRPALIELGTSWLPAAEMVVDKFVLMESRLKSGGAQYIPLATFGAG